jgi:cyclophilin family peptidyl-prolyl cis-trans isomerase
MAGERGIGRYGKPMQYAHTRFHRAMPDMFVQGGDIVHGDGSGGESIYASPQTPTFRDENFKLCHDQAGAWQPLTHS